MFESAAQAIDRKIDDPSSPQFCFILILPISFSCNSSGDLPVERKRDEEEEEGGEGRGAGSLTKLKFAQIVMKVLIDLHSQENRGIY